MKKHKKPNSKPTDVKLEPSRVVILTHKLEPAEIEALRLLACQREAVDFAIQRYERHLLGARKLETNEGWRLSEDLTAFVKQESEKVQRA